MLSDISPTEFLRHGPIGASPSHIVDALTPDDAYRPHFTSHCPNGHVSCLNQPPERLRQSLPTLCHHTAWQKLVADSGCGSVTASSVSTQAWVNFAITALSKSGGASSCANCGALNVPRAFYACPPPLLTFEVDGQLHPRILPSSSVMLPGDAAPHKYSLRGVIYLGSYHFNTRIIDKDRQVWQHDGRCNDGTPAFDRDATVANKSSSDCLPTLMSSLRTADAHMYIYCLEGS
ncbi:hypothetical protein EV424DRAFT_1314768 [Suillus variegatus]|nr:hypothetical protein EV424DRAFT_1321497 [Suillus variegatus]KAG1831001.1 hypothetical protein EV424DRAFT_1314768 [Suillus variegatus]